MMMSLESVLDAMTPKISTGFDSVVLCGKLKDLF